MNEILRADVAEAAEAAVALAGKTLLITGATGLIGAFMAQTVRYANRHFNAHIDLYLQVRDEEKARTRLEIAPNDAAVHWVVGDIRDPIAIEAPIDLILHGAGVTSSQTIAAHPVETIAITLDGTRRMLELAREKGVERMVFLSSMEAFGQVAPSASPVRESDLGYIDLTSARSAYPESKRMAECLCAAYAHEYGVPVVSARLAQTFGAGIADTENRVFAQFARRAVAGQSIVLHTPGRSSGNYVYTSDCARALITLLANGVPGATYTVVNEATHTTIADLARCMAEQAGVSVAFDIPESGNPYGYAPETHLRLSAEKLRALGWSPRVSLPEMVRRLLASLKS